jgi:hypothetical protein
MALMGVLALGLGSTAYANLCATDVVPAATLLFPFVQYDYENPDGGDATLFAITNVSSEAQIVHITIWTDYSVAILDFNVILTGYDVVTMNIRDILGTGTLPGPLNGNTIWEEDNEGGSPWDDGPVSDFNELATYDFGVNNLPDPEPTWDGAVVGPPGEYLDCDPDFWDSSPNNYDIQIGSTFLGTLEGYLKASQTADKWYEDCAGVETAILDAHGMESWFITRDSGPVWMYITADVVDTCNKLLPDADATYWDTVQMDNVLIGDTIWFNSDMNTSETDNALHLEAAPFSFSTPVGNDSLNPPTTFYYKHNLGIPGDGREPLPTAWAFRYLYLPEANVNTWIRAFKSGTESAIVEDLNDGSISGPGPADLYANSCLAYTYYAWDEDENVNSVGPGEEPPWSGEEGDDPVPVPNLLPLETQEVGVDQFFIVGTDEAAFGWLLFVWPRSNTDALVAGEYLAYDQYQTWMGTKIAAFGQYTAGKSAAVMANWNCDATPA